MTDGIPKTYRFATHGLGAIGRATFRGNTANLIDWNTLIRSNHVVILGQVLGARSHDTDQLDEASRRAADDIADTVIDLWCADSLEGPAATNPGHFLGGVVPLHLPPLVARALRIWGGASSLHRLACTRIVEQGLERGAFSARNLIWVVDEWLTEPESRGTQAPPNEAACTVLNALPQAALLDLLDGLEPDSPRTEVLLSVLQALWHRAPFTCVRLLQGWMQRGGGQSDHALAKLIAGLNVPRDASSGELFRLQRALVALQVSLSGTRAQRKVGALVKAIRDERSRRGERKRSRSG